jgi:cephalosporin hydroxylase
MPAAPRNDSASGLLRIFIAATTWGSIPVFLAMAAGVDSFVVVFDAVMARVHDSPRAGEGWDHDNPLTAADEFLLDHPEFERCPEYERFGVTHCHGGFLRRRPARPAP